MTAIHKFKIKTTQLHAMSEEELQFMAPQEQFTLGFTDVVKLVVPAEAEAEAVLFVSLALVLTGKVP